MIDNKETKDGGNEEVGTPSDMSEARTPLERDFIRLNSHPFLTFEIIPHLDEESVNPFVNSTPSCWQKFKTVFFVVSGLVLVRLLVCLVMLLLGLLVATLVSCCQSKDSAKPVSCFQRALMYVNCIILRFALMVSGFWWIPVSWDPAAYEAYKQGEIGISVSNHVSPFDFFILLYVFRAVSCMANAKMLATPCLGSIFKRLGDSYRFIWVDRRTKESKQQAVRDLMNRAENPVLPLIMFPQGTTFREDVLSKFKTGAFRHGQSVVPVIIRYPNNSSLSGGGRSFHGTFFLAWCQFANFVNVEILAPYTPTEQEVASPPLYANNVRKLMHEKMGPTVKLSEHTFADVALRSQILKLPQGVSGFQLRRLCMANLQTELGMTLDEVIALTKLFSDFDPTGHGKLNQEEFAEMGNLEVTSKPCKRLFRVMLDPGESEIGFPNLISFWATIRSPHLHEDVLGLFFEVVQTKGEVCKADVESYVQALKVAVDVEDFTTLFSEKKLDFDEFKEQFKGKEALIQKFFRDTLIFQLSSKLQARLREELPLSNV